MKCISLKGVPNFLNPSLLVNLHAILFLLVFHRASLHLMVTVFQKNAILFGPFKGDYQGDISSSVFLMEISSRTHAAL